LVCYSPNPLNGRNKTAQAYGKDKAKRSITTSVGGFGRIKLIQNKTQAR